MKLVGGAEWLVERAVRGWVGSAGGPGPGMAGAGNDVSVSSAIGACVAGNAGREGGRRWASTVATRKKGTGRSLNAWPRVHTNTTGPMPTRGGHPKCLSTT